MADRKVVVEIIGDPTKFTKATQQAIDSTSTLGGRLKTVGKGMVIGAGIASFNLLTDAIGAGIGKLGEAKQAFEDDQVSQAKLAQALKNNIPGWDGSTAAVEKYAAAQGRLGFTDDEIRDSIGQLIGVTHDLTEAQNLNSLAQDLARAKGIDLATATDAVNKAYNGQGKALKALGVDIGDAKTGADLLTAAQNNVKGSAEAWAATNEGKLAASNVKVGEAMERIGSVVSQVASVALPILADAFVAIVDVLGQVWDAIQPVVSAIAEALIPIIRKVLPVVQAVFGKVLEVVKALAPGFKIVFGIIGKTLEAFFTVLSAIFDAIGAAVGILQKVFKGLGDFIGRVFSIVTGIVRNAINGVISIINGVIGAINAIQVHIHVGPVDLDWNGLNIRKLPHLHSGGVVPGSPGSEVLTVLQAGETVTPAGQAGQTVIINIDSFIGSDSDIDRFANKVALRLAYGGMSTVPVVEIDGNDVTDELQDRSLSIKRQGVDLTLIDPAVLPALGDTLTVDVPAWSGTVIGVESTGYKGNVPFIKVRATNADTLPDNGAGAFNLSDAGSRYSSPAGFKDLSIQRNLENGVSELRAHCTVFKEGLMWGDEVELTSVVEGFSAELFTIMEMSVDYPTEDGATYTLDLGIGGYADATTGADNGHGVASDPLWPTTLGGDNGEITRIIKKYYRTSGSIGISPTLSVVMHQSAAYSAGAGAHTVDWDEFWEGSTGDVLGGVPADIGWSYDGSGTLTTLVSGTWLLDFSFSVSKSALGYLLITQSYSWGLVNGFSIPNALGDQSSSVSTFRVILPVTMPAGHTVSVDWSNTAAVAALNSAYLEITHIGTPVLI